MGMRAAVEAGGSKPASRCLLHASLLFSAVSIAAACVGHPYGRFEPLALQTGQALAPSPFDVEVAGRAGHRACCLWGEPDHRPTKLLPSQR